MTYTVKITRPNETIIYQRVTPEELAQIIQRDAMHIIAYALNDAR